MLLPSELGRGFSSLGLMQKVASILSIIKITVHVQEHFRKQPDFQDISFQKSELPLSCLGHVYYSYEKPLSQL